MQFRCALPMSGRRVGCVDPDPDEYWGTSGPIVLLIAGYVAKSLFVDLSGLAEGMGFLGIFNWIFVKGLR